MRIATTHIEDGDGKETTVDDKFGGSIERIEIVTGTGVTYILTPEAGELRISKQRGTAPNTPKPLSIRPLDGNTIAIS